MRRVAVILLLLTGCAPGMRSSREVSPKPIDLSIRLRWVKGYDSEPWSRVLTGLVWSFSQLGARPQRPLDALLVPVGPSPGQFDIDLGRLGFAPGVHRSLSAILDGLRESEEYEATGSIDMGRFVVTLLHISPHYYAITDAAVDLQTFYRRHDFSRAVTYAVMNSSVARHHRVIRLLQGGEAADMAFVAEEGTGSPAAGDFQAAAYETIDVMANGDLRFAIYDASGKLADTSPLELGSAGKPGKCMWCHESDLQPLYLDTPDVPGHLTRTQFVRSIEAGRERLNRHRLGLPWATHFANHGGHTYGELLYLSFMEPSVSRLAREWQMDPASVSVVMRNLPTRENDEFPFLGAGYERSLADARAPWGTLLMPTSVREPTAVEPSVLKPSRALPAPR